MQKFIEMVTESDPWPCLRIGSPASRIEGLKFDVGPVCVYAKVH